MALHHKTKWLLVFGAVIAMSACKKFDTFDEDPNRASEVSPDVILNTLSQKAFNQVSTDPALASRMLINTDGVSNLQYYGWQRGNYNEYNNLQLVTKMEQEARRVDQPAYLALAKFFKSWFSYDLTMRFGDIPYSEAAMADQGNYTPIYDTQEAVFVGILADLDTANTILSSDPMMIANDIIFEGQPAKWRKLVNSFRLRVLMALSAKAAHVSLGVKEQFAAIVADPATYPIMGGTADDAALSFFNAEQTQYPYYNNNGIKTAIYMEESFVDLLKSLEDPRLFRFADRAPDFDELPVDDFNAYDGGYGSASVDRNSARILAGEVSAIHERYHSDPVNEPATALGFAEVQFLLAEAAVRGWIGGDAEPYYLAGIEAAMEKAGVTADQTADYRAVREAEGLSSAPQSAIGQIITQKYIHYFMNAGWQPFYEQRRTGFPVFNVDGGAVVNDGRIPKRWMYPQGELTNNGEHVEAAISRQYPNGDNVNGTMWLLNDE